MSLRSLTRLALFVPLAALSCGDAAYIEDNPGQEGEALGKADDSTTCQDSGSGSRVLRYAGNGPSQVAAALAGGLPESCALVNIVLAMPRVAVSAAGPTLQVGDLCAHIRPRGQDHDHALCLDAWQYRDATPDETRGVVTYRYYEGDSFSNWEAKIAVDVAQNRVVSIREAFSNLFGASVEVALECQ